MILLIGFPADPVSNHVYQALQAEKQSVQFWDTSLFPKVTALSYEATTPLSGILRVSPDAEPIDLASIRSVFRCRTKTLGIPKEDDPLMQEAVASNVKAAFESFNYALDCRWCNSLESQAFHHFKPYLLKLMAANGIRVPRTLITNIPEDVRRFYEELKGEVIYKPVYGWGYTAKLSAEDLTDERLGALANMPYCFQEFIPGQDIRVYAVNGQLFPMEIQATSLDFREDPYAPRQVVALPESVQADCWKALALLKLVYAGIDIRRTPDGEYVFFEANPSPIYLHDEATSGLPITQNLVAYLSA
jgi:glutathione synthase/RimK-type ligase-like ATP-grasp enzyme